MKNNSSTQMIHVFSLKKEEKIAEKRKKRGKCLCMSNNFCNFARCIIYRSEKNTIIDDEKHTIIYVRKRKYASNDECEKK